jgi:hypothetical protein
MEDVPIIDMAAFLEDEGSERAKAECKKVVESLHKFGILIVKDPRANE